MKKMIALVLGLFLVGSVACANSVGVDIYKDVNGGYTVSSPVVIDAQSSLPFLPKAYIRFAPIFTAPRGNFSPSSLNHSRMNFVVGSQITLLGGQLGWETLMDYWWAGNSQGMPEGWVWGNNFSYKFTW